MEKRIIARLVDKWISLFLRDLRDKCGKLLQYPYEKKSRSCCTRSHGTRFLMLDIWRILKEMVVSDFIFALTILYPVTNGSVSRYMLFSIWLQMIQYPDTCYLYPITHHIYNIFIYDHNIWKTNYNLSKYHLIILF